MSAERWVGIWWLPGEPAEKRPGLLEEDDDGRMTLTLVGAFEQVRRTDIPEIPVIVGETENYGATLLDCFMKFDRRGRGGDAPEVQRFGVNAALLGEVLESAATPAFSSARLEMENLLHWLYPDQTGFDFESYWNPTLVQLPNAKVEYEGFHFDAGVSQHSFHPVRTRSETAVQAITAARLIITSEKPRSVKDFDSFTKSLTDLITLASGQASGVIRLNLDGPTSTEFPEGLDAEFRRRYVVTPDPAGNPQLPYRFAFTCGDRPFEELLPEWMRLWKRLRPAIDIFAQTYSPGGFLEQKVLEMGVAAEAIHRVLKDHSKIDQVEFEKLFAVMTENLDDDTKKWVGENFKNRLSFNDRMTELLQIPDQEAVNAVIPDRETWIFELKHRRNGMAHALAALPAKLLVNSNLRMRVLIKQTRTLITLVLMEQLKIASERQREYVTRDDELRYLSQQIASRS